MTAGALRGFARQPGAVVAAGFLLLLALLAIAAPWLYPVSPWAMVARPLTPPFGSLQVPLGSDLLGRDVLAGLIHGARTSLGIGAASTLATLLAGVAAGALAGYFGGWVDHVLMWISDAFQVLPGLFLAVILVAVLAPSTGSVVLAISLSSWPPVARIVRSEFAGLREREFVLAARVAGLPPLRIVFIEILPNALAPILVLASFVLAATILSESALSFLGLGDPASVSWGYMIDAARNLARQAWWLGVWPGLAIMATVLAANRVGEGLRRALQLDEYLPGQAR
ncbi:MAG: ABC transporter permease [Pseudoxanthomonas sp.]